MARQSRVFERGATTPSLGAAGRLALRLFSGALMSDTKWRKLFAVLKQADPVIGHMMVKSIDTDDVRRLRSPLSLSCPHGYMDTGEYGPVELRSIEWLEVEADLAPMLTAVGSFPLEPTAAGTRVVGYR